MKREDGVMAATRHLGCRVVRRVGSSPTWGTEIEDEKKMEIFSWIYGKETFYD